jgi:hypothetical protein
VFTNYILGGGAMDDFPIRFFIHNAGGTIPKEFLIIGKG